MILGVLFLFVLVGAKGGGLGDAVEGGPKATEHNQDKIQDEILKAMQDSGVLNEWQDKLDDMLYEGNEVETGPVDHLNPQAVDMLTSFVDAYTAENNIKLDASIIVSIVRRVQKTPSPNLPQIFVQLSPLIDVVSALNKKTDQLNNIIDRQGPVFESPAKTKDILHTLTENLKSELVRLTLDTPKAKEVPPPPKKKKSATKEKKQQGGGLDIADYLTLGSTLLKGGNAGQIMSLLSGEADFNSMLSLLPQLIESGNYKDILSKMIFGYLDQSPYGPIIKNMYDNFINSDQGKSTMDSVYYYVEMLAKSESGRRLVNILPKLMVTKDLETFLEIVHVEAEYNWAQVFENIENADYKEKTLEQLADYLVSAYNFVKKPPPSSMMARAPIFLNGFLISKGIPAFDSKRPTESLTAIINKCIKLFSTVKLDVTPYVKAASNTLTKSIETQSKGIKFDKLTTTQKKNLVARILDTELVEPAQAVWSIYDFASKNLDCAQHLLCQVNHKERSRGVESRIAVAKMTSLATAWALAQSKKRHGEKYFNLYKKAVWSGTNGDDCMSEYTIESGSCNLFPWQSKDFMSTSYDHIEL